MSRYSERRSKVVPMDFRYESEERAAPPSWSNDSPTKGSAAAYGDAGSLNGHDALVHSPAKRPSVFDAPSTPSSSRDPYWRPTGSTFANRESTPTRGGSMPPQTFASPETADVSMQDQTRPTGPFSPASRRTTLLDAMKEHENVNRQRATSVPVEEREDEEDEKALIKAQKVSKGGLRERLLNTRNRATTPKRRRTSEDSNEDERIRLREVNRDDRGMSPPIGLGAPSITANHHYTFNMPGAPESRSEVPYMLLGYVQFLFNFSLVLVFLYIIVYLIITVQRDVEHRMSEYRTDLVEHIAHCSQLYTINKCFPLSQRVPALARQCAEWESCMQRDPSGIGRTKVIAETIGEVINSFVEPISWKTLGFGLTSLGFLITLINVLFSFYRARVAPHHPSPAHIAAPPTMPPQYLPGTPASSRVLPPFLTPGPHYMAPAPNGVYGHAAGAGEWGRTWSGTEGSLHAPLPAPGTPSKKKGWLLDR